jgi:2-polyprenyl-6-methoxyphenol hydroxylase-like FAD-dependent oxidoreductase
MIHSPSIAIIGGGPAGLTLARILDLHGIEASVFERERHSATRPQGGSLDLHPESGQYALEQAGLTAEFKRVARYQDQEFRIYNKHGELLHLDESNAGDRPEIDRGQLRQILLDSLPEGRIRWDREISAIEPQNDGTFELVFKNGVNERFDLVVGADGAWSRTRPLLSDVRPIYSGVVFVELGIADADERHPQIARLVGHGMMFALGDSKAIIGHRDANAHIGIYAGFRAPEDWIVRGGVDLSSSEALKNSLLAHFEGWSENLLQIVRQCGDHHAPRAIYALPAGHRWQNRPGITLLGDAAHLMSPFSGEGANLAMLDAADLALALTSGSDWQASIEQFELKMFARAGEAAIGATQGIDETFSEQGLSHILAHVAALSSAQRAQ